MKKSHLIKPVVGSDYPLIQYGKGVYLYDQDGNAFLDGSSGAITANIGHGVEEVADAMWKQAKEVSFVYRSHFTSNAAEELAAKIAEKSPGDLNSVFFVNSGSEATETALKIAIQYFQEQGITTKTKILSRWTSYHGITLGALSMSGHPMRRERFETLLEDFPSAPPPYCFQCPLNKKYPECGIACAHELETAIQSIGPENIAAFIFEPVIGASGGAITPPDEYYPRIKEICEKYNILTIADEVMTGMGRTGKMFAVEHWKMEPDLMALGKGLSAGYTPMAATLVSDRIMDVIEKGSKVIMGGHTFSANPQSAAACLAVLHYFDNHNLLENTEKQGVFLQQKLLDLKNKYQLIGDVRGKGLLCGMELVQFPESKTPFPLSHKVTERLIAACFKKGLIIYPAIGGVNGYSGDSVLICPPLTISKEEIEHLIQMLDEGLAELTIELSNEGLFTLGAAK